MKNSIDSIFIVYYIYSWIHIMINTLKNMEEKFWIPKYGIGLIIDYLCLVMYSKIRISMIAFSFFIIIQLALYYKKFEVVFYLS